MSDREAFDARPPRASPLHDKLFALLGAILGMLTLPYTCFTLRSIGPAARVEFYDYLPLVEYAMYLLATAVGAALGAYLPSVHRSRWPRWRLLAFAGVVAWTIAPQLGAFPAHANVAERDAWARVHVRHYAALTRVAAALPELQADLGSIVAIAPTSNDQHTYAREMDGDDMRFSLEVVGAKGTGTLHADCTLDDYRVYDWRTSKWQFAGRELVIRNVADRVPH